MSKNVNVAIVGLGKVGGTFLEKLLDYNGKGITIKGVSETNDDAPGLKLAKDKGIPIFKECAMLIGLGEELDIIFELTGNPEARRTFRMAMVKSNNSHTAIVPEMMAHLIWNIIGEDGALPSHDNTGY